MGSGSPKTWALDKRDKARRYVVGEVRDAIVRAAPVLCPGVPFEAVVGACLNGGRNENTTGWRTCSVTERDEARRTGRKPLGGDALRGYGALDSDDLHELGPLGAEAGHVPGLVAAEGTPWAQLAMSPGVRLALGRPGVIGGDWHGNVADQITIGLASVARHGASVAARLPASIRPNLNAWTLWTWALALAGWSAGDGGMVRHVSAYADRLAALPEAQRWAEFCRLAGSVDDPGYKHRADEYTALRTRQKLEGARLAARLTGNTCALAWLDDGAADSDAIDAALVKAST